MIKKILNMAIGIAGVLIGVNALATEKLFVLPFISSETKITATFYSYYWEGQPHGGTDFSLPEGTPVTAGYKGIVEKIVDGRPNTYPWHYEYGNYIKINHENGYKTIYVHLKSGEIKVKEGQSVRWGEIIALSGNSGYSTAPHLHFEVQYNGVKVDPYGDNPNYPYCGSNYLWVTNPPSSPIKRYPPGTLLKSPDLPRVYVVDENGRLRWIRDETVFKGHRFFDHHIIEVLQTVIEAYPQGPNVINTADPGSDEIFAFGDDFAFQISKMRSATKYLWDATMGKRRPFPNDQVYESWGWTNLVYLKFTDWQALAPLGPPVNFRSGYV